MERWNCQTKRREEVPAVDNFISEIEAVCQKHGLAISREVRHPSLLRSRLGARFRYPRRPEPSPLELPFIRILRFIKEPNIRAKVLALAAAKELTAVEDACSPGWITFYAVTHPDQVLKVLRSVGLYQA